MNPRFSFNLAFGVSCAAFLLYAIAAIVAAEHFLAEDKPNELVRYIMTAIALYAALLFGSRAILSRILDTGSSVFVKCMPEERKAETVVHIARTCAFFGWFPACIYVIYTTFSEASLDVIAANRRPFLYVCCFINVVDALSELTSASSKTLTFHHIVMVSLTLLMAEWDRTFEPGWMLLAIQNAMDRAVWPVVMASRLTYYRNRWETTTRVRRSSSLVTSVSSIELSQSAGSSAFVLPVSSSSAFSAPDSEETSHEPHTVTVKEGDVILPRAFEHHTQDPLDLTDLDTMLPDSNDDLRPHFAVCLVYYLGVRVLVDILMGVYLARYWSEVPVYWRVILTVSCAVFNLIDIDVYFVMFRRSSFSAKRKEKSAGDSLES